MERSVSQKKNTVIKTDKMLLMEVLDQPGRSIEQQIIDALVENKRVKAHAARSMGISSQLITKWIKMLNIDLERITPEKHSQWSSDLETITQHA